MLRFLLLATALHLFATPPSGVPLFNEGFSRKTISANNVFNPDQFKMQQSYTMGYTSSSYGSYSHGTYLNTISYQVYKPLTLFVDMGMQNIFHSSLSNSFVQHQENQPELLFPSFGLNYKASDSFNLSIQFINGQDYYKAGRNSYFSPYSPHRRF